jgi:hypothetical protein
VSVGVNVVLCIKDNVSGHLSVKSEGEASYIKLCISVLGHLSVKSEGEASYIKLCISVLGHLSVKSEGEASYIKYNLTQDKSKSYL